MEKKKKLDKWYIDNYGVAWLRMTEGIVFNNNVGYGTWDNGKGLRLMSDEEILNHEEDK